MSNYNKVNEEKSHLYQHNLVITGSSSTNVTEIHLKIFNNSNVKISTYSDLLNFLEDNNFVVKTGFINPYQATGVYEDAYDSQSYCRGIVKNNNFIAVRCLTGKNFGTYSLSELSYEIEDTIIQLI